MLKWRIIALILCILSLCGIVTVCLLYSLSGGEVPFDYGIVIDAGSTHSQITLYRWKGDKDEGTGEVIQIRTCKVDGGIHNFKNFSDAGKSLLPCFTNLSTSLPTNHISTTPVYLGATAGMRLLNLSDPDLAEAILLEIHDTLKSNGYDVKNVSIISGKIEGLFAWITANFLSDKLECNQNQISTFGTLDLGGASTQIAFEIEDSREFDNNTLTTIKLYGNTHHIFSKSFLCFGVVETDRRYHAMLVEDLNRTDVIADPCGLKDNVINHTADYLFDHPCTKSHKYETWLHSNESKEDKIYYFRGLGDSQECAKAVRKFMNFETCQKSYKYCFKPLQQSLTDVKYMAISSYYYVAKFLQLNLTNSTMDQYKTAMDSFCNTSYEIAVKIDPEEADYVSGFCFEAHYIFYLLTEEYKFNATFWNNIAFINKINKFNVGWSLGYMIDETTLLPTEKPEPPIISLTAFVTVSIVCFILLVVSAIFVLRFCTFRPQSGYRRIAEP